MRRIARLRCSLFGHRAGYDWRGKVACQRCGLRFKYVTPDEYEHGVRYGLR